MSGSNWNTVANDRILFNLRGDGSNNFDTGKSTNCAREIQKENLQYEKNDE